jgi:hypothetical protein
MKNKPDYVEIIHMQDIDKSKVTHKQYRCIKRMVNYTPYRGHVCHDTLIECEWDITDALYKLYDKCKW